MNEEQSTKLQNYKPIHWLVIGLIGMNIVMRTYYLLTQNNNNTTFLVINALLILVVLIILIQLIKMPALGVKISSVWYLFAALDLFKEGIGIFEFNLFQISYSAIIVLIFILSLFMWWKVYNFESIMHK